MKYRLEGNTIFVDDEAVARVELLSGEFNEAKLTDMIPAACRAVTRHHPEPVAPSAPPGLINDLDESGAGGFLAAHHVPIIGPEMGTELLKVVRRLETVGRVYQLPPTVDVYRLALHLILQVATEHQRAFCARLEEALGE
jgi:hypothetical protein